MEKGMSYIKDSRRFQENIKTLECIPDDAILAIGDVVGLYSNIPHQVGLIALKEGFGQTFEKDIN